MGDILELLTAIGSIATPIFVLVLTGIGWLLKSTIDRKTDIENKLRDNRIEIYNEIIEPFVILLTPQAAWDADPKNRNKNKDQIFAQKYLSQDYRKNAFKLALIANDDVVEAYNNLCQFTYAMEKIDLEKRTKMMIQRLGGFLLEIRKSMGNKATRLDRWQVLEWFLKDIDNFKNA